jgi:hypothetical protein
MSAPGKRVVPVAAKSMRVNVQGRNLALFTAKADVGATDTGGLFTSLPVPVVDGPGAPVDISALGTFTTFIVGGSFQGATVSVEVSEDGVDYFACGVSFSGEGGLHSRDVIANFARTFVRGHDGNAALFTPTVSLGAINDAEVDTDELVKATALDTTAGYLDEKLLPGSAVDFTLVDPGGDEKIEISVQNATAQNIATAAPITVKGSTNEEGTSEELARATHRHRLELGVFDEGVPEGYRPIINFVGVGVGAVDNAVGDRVDITIPGTSDGGAVVSRFAYVDSGSSTSGNIFVDGMAGDSVTVPIDGDYFALWEGECEQSNANSTLEVGVSVNSLVAIVPNSERISKGAAVDVRTFTTSIHLGALLAGDLVRGLFRKVSGAGSVGLGNRNLTIFRIQ